MSTPALDWQRAAACRRADVDATLFFAPDGELEDDRVWREAQAKAVCDGCAVWARCLDYRLSFEHQLDGGIWAGRGEDERKALRHARMKRQQQGRKAA